MYLRFTVPAAHGGTVTRARLAPGPFRAAHDAWRGLDDRNDPIGIALRRELDWFNEHLPIPRRFAVIAKGRWWSDGVCWFRDDARQMLAHAHALAALLGDCGIPVEHCWTRDPGQLLYRDRWQVVAKPDRYRLN